jgi:hypothetical protein
MEAKDIGKILGAAALATLPTVTGFYVYGKMKDKRSSTGASALVGGLTFTTLTITVALLNYYMFGLDTVTKQVSNLIGPGKASDEAVAGLLGAIVPERVVGPFTDNFRQLGAMPRRGEFYRPQGLGRVGCCGR